MYKEHLTKEKYVYRTFMDLERDYDKIDSETMGKVLRVHRECKSYLGVIQRINAGRQASISVGSDVSEWIQVSVRAEKVLRYVLYVLCSLSLWMELLSG